MQTERKWIDLRSDTVTQPTQQMREAMFNAQVGDDVYGDDPTMNELEKKAAEMLGKEAALFMASGTMGNAVAVMSHTNRGDEIILSDTAHIVAHEVGGAAVLSQAFIRTLHFENGIFDAEQIRSAIRDRSNIHYPRTGLICVEEPLVFHRLHKDAATNACMKDSRRYEEEKAMFQRLWPRPAAEFLMRFYKKAYTSYEENGTEKKDGK